MTARIVASRNLLAKWHGGINNQQQLILVGMSIVAQQASIFEKKRA